jgi:sulfur carrier protein
VKVLINGEARELTDGATVADLVERSGLETARRRGVAVAVDTEVIPRSEWESTRLSEGQAVELVTAIQGG